MKFAELWNQVPVIAILRGVHPDRVVAVCDILREAGIRLAEVPLNTPDAIESIRRAADHFRDSGEFMLGAGTVLTPDAVRQVRDAGGGYMVAPNCDARVIRAAKECGMVAIPGFYTATEAFQALEYGADYLKLFPAENAGIGYIQALKAVIAAPIVAVGGITPDNAAEYCRACSGIGIGSALFAPRKTLEQLRLDAATLMQNIRAVC